MTGHTRTAPDGVRSIGAPPSLRVVLSAMRRYWALAIAVVLACASLGALVGSRAEPVATATAAMLVENPRSEGLFGDGGTDATYVANQVALLELPSTAEKAARVLADRGLASVDANDLESGIHVSNSEGNDLIELSYSDADPRIAQAAVDAYLDAYAEMLRGGAAADQQNLLVRLDEALAELDQQMAAVSGASRATLRMTYDDLLRRKAEALALDSTDSSGISTISEATLPEVSLPLAIWVTASMAGLLGLLPAALACFLAAHARRRFDHRFGPESVLGVPLLTEIPDFRAERLSSDVPVVDAPTSASAEAFRFGATLLGVRRAERGSTLHAVVSAASQDGKSTVTANLAVTTAQAGSRVLAVDGDLGGRGLSFLLLNGDVEGPGLVDVLEGRVSLKAAVVQLQLPGGAVLDVLRGGSDSGDVSQLLLSARSRQRLGTLGDDYDEVLVDVPPVLQVAYAASLVRAADAVVIVIPHHASVGRTENLLERLEVLEVNMAGYLYNMAPLRRELGVQSMRVTDSRRRARHDLLGRHRANDSATATRTGGPPLLPARPTAPQPQVGPQAVPPVRAEQAVAGPTTLTTTQPASGPLPGPVTTAAQPVPTGVDQRTSGVEVPDAFRTQP